MNAGTKLQKRVLIESLVCLLLLTINFVDPQHAIAQDEKTVNVDLQFERAIQANDTAAIKRCVESDSKILTRTLRQNRQPPLHYAIFSGKLESVKQLIELGAPLGSDNPQKRSALHVALAQKNLDIVGELISKTKNFESTDRSGATPLFGASMYRHLPVEILEAMIKSGANLNAVNRSQQSPLHVACYHRLPDRARILINAGADLSLKDSNQNTPLHASCMSCPDVFELMLEKGADLTVKNRQGQSLLHLACQSGEVGLAKKLLPTLKSEIDAIDRAGRTPLMSAVYRNNIPIIKMLINNGANVNGARASKLKLDPPLVYAVRLMNKELIQLLVDSGANLNLQASSGETALHAAASANGMVFSARAQNDNMKRAHMGSLLLLLAKGANPNLVDGRGKTPLQTAAEHNFVDAVEALVDRTENLDFNLGTGSMLHWTAQGGLIKTANRLVKSKNVDLNATNSGGQTPLHVAAQSGELAFVDFLLKRNAKMDVEDSNGMYPLLLAASEGHAKVVESLIKNGDDFGRVDSSGQSALHMAAWNGNDEVVDVLLKNLSAQMLAQMQSGYSPLHAAAWKGHSKVVSRLVAAGCDMNVADSDGWTPLHKSAYRGHADAVKVLLQAGADKKKTNIVGMTALDMAIGNKKNDVAEMLK